MTNKRNTTFCIGVTSELKYRIWQHKNKTYSNSFTTRYNLVKQIYYESYPTIEEAIAKEKQLKRLHRAWKINLITSVNPDFKDLYEDIKDL